MPTINLTNKQAAKIQNAADIYNADTGENLTAKQWAKQTLKGAVQNTLLSATNFLAQAEADAEAAELAARTAIEDDWETP